MALTGARATVTAIVTAAMTLGVGANGASSAVDLLAAGRLAQNPPAQVPPPTPKPFPQPGQSGGTATPPVTATPAPAAPQAASPAGVSSSATGTPTETTLGAPIFTGAELLTSVDAGQGQRYYLYGTSAPYQDVVAFYKQALKTGGRELFKAPAMQQFDLGKFQEDSMVFVPSVVVKDYTWNGSAGYLQVTGTTEKRFATVIQIVPVTAR